MAAVLQRLAERNQHRIFTAAAIRYKIEQDKKAWPRPPRSKYMPHQGKREIARRLARAKP